MWMLRAIFSCSNRHAFEEKKSVNFIDNSTSWTWFPPKIDILGAKLFIALDFIILFHQHTNPNPQYISTRHFLAATGYEDNSDTIAGIPERICTKGR